MPDKEENQKKTQQRKSLDQVQLVLPPRFFWRTFLLLAALVIFFLLIWNIDWFWRNLLALLGMLTPFIVGAALAFVIKIPMNEIERMLRRNDWLRPRRGITRVFSILLSLLFVTVFFVGLITLVLPQVVQSLNMLVDRMPALVNQVADWMEGTGFLGSYAESVRTELGDFSWDIVVDRIGDFLRTGAGVFDNVINTVRSIMSGLTNTVISFLFMIYLLAAKERLERQSRRLLYSFSKESVADKVMYVFHIMHSNFTAFVSGTVIGAVVAGLLTFIAMIVLRLPYPGMVSIVIAVASLVPIIGSIVGVAIGTLIVFITSPLQALVFLIVVIILMQIEGNIIFPRLVGKAMGLPAMWTLLAISLGGSLLGILGIWFFVPLFSSGYALLAEISAVRLRKKEIDLSAKSGREVAYEVRTAMGMSSAEAKASSTRSAGTESVQQSFRQFIGSIRAKFSVKKDVGSSQHGNQEQDASRSDQKARVEGREPSVEKELSEDREKDQD